MKNLFISIEIIFFCLGSIFSQSFTIKINPDTIIVNQGNNALFQLNAIPSGGFNASIFLTLQEFQTNAVTISPSTLNSPYNNCSITISTNNCSLGIHRLIIKGQQGSLVSYDTVFVEVSFNPSLKWYQFNSNNSGLLGNNPYDIAIDKYNNIWICSDSGITKYDRNYWYSWGKNTFKKADFWGSIITQENNSMINCSVLAISIDSNNVKWIATENGLVKYNDSTYNFLFTGENISSVACYNNKVCAGTISNGIKYFNGQNWFSFTTSNSYLPGNSIRKIIMENDTIIWIGTQNGIAKYDINYWTIYNSSNSILTNNYIYTIALDKSKNKYFSAMGTGLIKFDNSTFKEYTPPCSEIGAIFPDKIGNIWLGFISGNTNNALVKFDGTNWIEFNSTNSGFNSSPATPGYGRIYCINEDKNGVLWIGTFGDGIFAYSEDSLKSIFPIQLISTQITIPPFNDLKVYPNPAKNYLIIETQLKHDKNDIIIYNISGQIVKKQQLIEENTQIDIRNFPRGLYFVKLINNNTFTVKKIIKE